MKSKRLEFTGSLGHKLSALLDLPETGQPSAFGIFAHCFTCNKNYKILNHVNQALTEHQIAVLRFDFTGLGASQGSFADTNFSSNVEDIIAAANFLDINYDAPQLLIGHSLGGAAVIRAANKISSCRAVVAIATPANLDSIRHLILTKKEELETKGETVVTIFGRQFRIKKQILDDLEQNNLTKSITELKKPLLIFHSSADAFVPIENAYQIFTMANHPKGLITLTKSDHLLSDEIDARYVGQIIAAWSSEFFQS